MNGSYFGDFNNFTVWVPPPPGTSGSGSYQYKYDANLLRANLGMRGNALAAVWGFNQNWIMQTMGLGETIGQAVLMSQNHRPSDEGAALYKPIYTNAQGKTYETLLGDPTLTMAAAKAVSQVTETINLASGAVELSWTAPQNQTPLRYEVYRASSLYGQFALATTVTNGTSTTISNPGSSDVYMVRAVRMEFTASGTYENASTGVFATKVIIDGVNSGTGSADTIHLKRTIGTGGSTEDSIDIWTSPIRSGLPHYTLDYRTTAQLIVNGNAGDDTLTIDHSDGNPVPTAGLTFNGASGMDTLLIGGTSGADTISFAGPDSNSGSIVVNGGTTVTTSL